MERLTTNKDVQEMTMTELAHNCCYAEDRKARYRDFDMDMDSREFARNLMITLANDELPNDDDEFDEEILENLQYDQFSDVKGLIALFYRNLWAMADLRETLKSYEDLEEQGLLLRLPVAVGENVFVVRNNADACCDCGHFEKGYCCDDYCNNKTVKDEDEDIYPSYPQYSDNPLCEKHFWEVVERKTKLDWIIRNIGNFGKTVFLTKEEAELELANRQQSHAEAIMDERNGI